MLYKILYVSLLMILSFSTTATAIGSHDICAAIKTPDKRLKCYDALAKQSTNRLTPITSQQAVKSQQSVSIKPSDMNAVSVLKAYISESKWQDRVKYVRSGERVRTLMQEAYANNYKPFQNENIRVYPAEQRNIPIGGWISLTAEWVDNAFDGEKIVDRYIVFRSDKGFKVDWEASIGYNPTRLSAFVVKQSNIPYIFRVSCKLSNYYNYEYGDTKLTHYSVSAEADGVRVHGYVPRKSATGERIYKLLQDGLIHPLVLQFQQVGPLGESMRDSNSQGDIVAITKLVAESWVLPD